MKTEKQIEEMADKKFPFSWLGRPDKAREEKCKQEGFIEGYTQAQKDLLAEASEGFDEWLNVQCNTYPHIKNWLIDNKGWIKAAWHASRLPLMKKIEELRSVIKLKDEFMQASVCLGGFEKLQKENEDLREELGWATKTILEYSYGPSERKSKSIGIRTKFSLDKNDKGAV